MADDSFPALGISWAFPAPAPHLVQQLILVTWFHDDLAQPLEGPRRLRKRRKHRLEPVNGLMHELKNEHQLMRACNKTELEQHA